MKFSNYLLVTIFSIVLLSCSSDENRVQENNTKEVTVKSTTDDVKQVLDNFYPQGYTIDRTEVVVDDYDTYNHTIIKVDGVERGNIIEVNSTGEVSFADVDTLNSSLTLVDVATGQGQTYNLDENAPVTTFRFLGFTRRFFGRDKDIKGSMYKLGEDCYQNVTHTVAVLFLQFSNGTEPVKIPCP